MTLVKVEGLVVEHAVALGRLEQSSDKHVKKVSDLNLRYAENALAAKDFEVMFSRLLTSLALTEKDIIELKAGPFESHYSPPYQVPP